jgi:hypothetical protein
MDYQELMDEYLSGLDLNAELRTARKSVDRLSEGVGDAKFAIDELSAELKGMEYEEVFEALRRISESLECYQEI